MEQKIKLGNAYFVKNEPDNYTKSTTKSADGKKITVVNVVNGTEQAPFDFQGGGEVPTDVARTGQENIFTKDQHFKDATTPVVVDMDNLNVDGDTTLDDLQVNGDATFVNAVVVGEATSDTHAIRKKQVDDNFIKKTEKAVANGVASLDGSGKIPLAQLNDAIVGQLTFGGNCEKTGTPEILKAYPSSDLKDKLGITDSEIQLIDSDTDDTTTTPKKYGYKTLKKVFFLCRNSFTAKGEGGATVTFKIGDWLIGTGSYWDRIENTDTVVSVNGKDGVVVLTGTDLQTSATDTDTIDVALGKKEDSTNKTTTLASTSTDKQYPSAKAVYDELVKKVDTETTTDDQTYAYGYDKTGKQSIDITAMNDDIESRVSKSTTTDEKEYAYGYDKTSEKVIDITAIKTDISNKVEKTTTTDEHTHIYGYNKTGETTVDLTSELGNKLSKVATTSTKDQMYVKKADGSQAMVDVPTIPTKTSELTNYGSDGNSQYIDGLFGTTDPTTATKGYFLGQIYTNKTNGKTFKLEKIEGTTTKTYTWLELTTVYASYDSTTKSVIFASNKTTYDSTTKSIII